MRLSRNIQIDIIKAVGIILVVMGHSSFPHTHFVYLFHLAIFFIATGYFFKEDHVKDFQSLKKFIINKVKRLYLPYVIGNGICILLNNFFIDLNIYNITNHQYYTIKEIIINIIKVMLFKGNTEMLGATWFLGILFIITISYAIIEYVLNKNINIKKHKNKIQLLIAVVLLLLGCYLSREDFNIKFINLSIFTCYILFYIGERFRKYEKDRKNIIRIVITLLSFVFLILLDKYGTIELSKNEYTNPIYFIIVSLLGWYMVYNVSYYLSKLKIINKILQYIGEHTMPILIFHFIAFKIINLVLVIVLRQDYKLIGNFPVLYKDNHWWIIYTIFGIGIPLLINKIWILLKSRNRKEL